MTEDPHWVVRKEKLKEMGLTYQQYLLSDHWRNLRKRYASSSRGKACYACGDTSKRWDLHHRHYRRLGEEHLNDLLRLCPECHAEAHDIEKRGENLENCAKRLKRRNERRRAKIQSGKDKRAKSDMNTVRYLAEKWGQDKEFVKKVVLGPKKKDIARKRGRKFAHTKQESAGVLDVNSLFERDDRSNG